VWEKGEIEMEIKRALTRVLMNWLPADDQARMVADFIAWLYADLPPAGQQEKIERLGPRLIEMIGEGRFGLPMLIYHHLLRLPPLRWLDRWVTPVEAPAEGQLAPLASRWP
jgi:hypothetical protein